VVIINLICVARSQEAVARILDFLESRGVLVARITEPQEAFDLASNGRFDVLLVLDDIKDPVEFLKSLRSGKAPKDMGVIFLQQTSGVAPACALERRLEFFDYGADDCLPVNCDAREVLSRIKAVYRRAVAPAAGNIVRLGAIEIDLDKRQVAVNGNPVELTAKEFELLFAFVSMPNRVLSRQYLIERVWGYSYFGSPRTVDVHVTRLRRKLGPESRYIKTMPCAGYKLVP